MTREETINLLMTIQAAYPNYKPQDKTVAVNIWHTMFEEYEASVVMLALKNYIATDTSGFAPSIGQIISKIQGMKQIAQGELTEMSAWAMVSKALRDSSYHAEERFAELPEIVQKAVGSPSNLRNWSQTDINSIENVIQSNFIKSFRAMQKRQEEYDRLPQTVKIAISKVNEVGLLERKEGGE